MFGYVKPFIPDLRVRELEMYKGLYCGLCRSMGKYTGILSRLTLSYDFTFLAALRCALQKCDVCPKTCRCAVHPLKKRACVKNNEALKYCASAAAILNYAKLCDDINDSHGIKKLPFLCLLPFFKAMKNKALKLYNIDFGIIEKCLSDLSRLEKENCPYIDKVADKFGEVLSYIFSFGLDENSAKIASVLGFAVGKYIYITDAADDIERDGKKKNYNPLLISPMSADSLSVAIRLQLEKAEAAVNLIDFTGFPEIKGIMENTVCEGLYKNALKIISEKNKSDFSLK